MNNGIIIGTPVFYSSDVRIATDNTDNRWQESAWSWEVSCEAIAPAPADDPIKRLLDQEPTFDVTIERPIGKLPRKMKKAYSHSTFNKNTKWMRKLQNYLKTRKVVLTDCTMDMFEDKNGINASIIKQDENK